MAPVDHRPQGAVPGGAAVPAAEEVEPAAQRQLQDPALSAREAAPSAPRRARWPAGGRPAAGRVSATARLRVAVLLAGVKPRRRRRPASTKSATDCSAASASWSPLLPPSVGRAAAATSCVSPRVGVARASHKQLRRRGPVWSRLGELGAARARCSKLSSTSRRWLVDRNGTGVTVLPSPADCMHTSPASFGCRRQSYERGELGQRHPAKLGLDRRRDLDGKARLADPARPDEGNQAPRPHQFTHPGDSRSRPMKLVGRRPVSPAGKRTTARRSRARRPPRPAGRLLVTGEPQGPRKQGDGVAAWRPRAPRSNRLMASRLRPAASASASWVRTVSETRRLEKCSEGSVRVRFHQS